MTQEEILENNKLIAKFMGFKFLTREEYTEVCYCPIGGIIYMPSSYCNYHSSWDWLMPCIGKISNLCEVPEELDGLKYALLCNDIDTAWEFVVDYLKKLNL